MDQRERFNNLMHFKNVDRVPFNPIPIGIWRETELRWRNEGLPPDFSIAEVFDFERPLYMDIYFGFCPAFEKKFIDEDETTITYVNFEGIKMRELKQNSELSMPHFLEFPVKNRKDFIKLLPRLKLNEDKRFLYAETRKG